MAVLVRNLVGLKRDFFSYPLDYSLLFNLASFINIANGSLFPSPVAPLDLLLTID